MLRIFRHYHPVPALFLCVCETSVVALALYGAASYLIPAAISVEANLARYLAAALVPALVNAVLMYSMGLYDPPHVTNFRRALPRLAACLCIGAPLLGRTLVVEGPSGHEPVLLYPAWTALVVACIVLARMVATPLTRTGFPRAASWSSAPAGSPPRSKRCWRAGIRAPRWSGYVALAGDPSRCRSRASAKSAGLAARHWRASGVGEIVVALDDRRGMPLKPLLEARMEGIAITPYL